MTRAELAKERARTVWTIQRGTTIVKERRWVLVKKDMAYGYVIDHFPTKIEALDACEDAIIQRINAATIILKREQKSLDRFRSRHQHL